MRTLAHKLFGDRKTTNWKQYTTRTPFPKEGQKHLIPREQALKDDPRTPGKVLLGVETEQGGIKRVDCLSVWMSQIGVIADFFVEHPKAAYVVVNWIRTQENKIIATVEAL